jgi:hypothetical protein
MTTKKSILSSDSNPNTVTLTPNAPGVRTPIFRARVPRGATLVLRNSTNIRGIEERGVHLIVDLRDAAGNLISGTSKLTLGVKAAAAEFETNLRTFPYTIWRDLTTAQQRNEDFIRTLVGNTDLNQPGFALKEGSELVIQLESTEVVDWTKSHFEITFEELN